MLKPGRAWNDWYNHETWHTWQQKFFVYSIQRSVSKGSPSVRVRIESWYCQIMAQKDTEIAKVKFWCWLIIYWPFGGLEERQRCFQSHIANIPDNYYCAINNPGSLSRSESMVSIRNSKVRHLFQHPESGASLEMKAAVEKIIQSPRNRNLSNTSQWCNWDFKDELLSRTRRGGGRAQLLRLFRVKFGPSMM